MKDGGIKKEIWRKDWKTEALEMSEQTSGQEQTVEHWYCLLNRRSSFETFFVILKFVTYHILEVQRFSRAMVYSWRLHWESGSIVPRTGDSKQAKPASKPRVWKDDCVSIGFVKRTIFTSLTYLRLRIIMQVYPRNQPPHCLHCMITWSPRVKKQQKHIG